jgi:hypothetical protein
MFNKNSWIKIFLGVEFICSLALEIYLILKARRFLKKQKSTNFQKSSSLDKLVFLDERFKPVKFYLDSNNRKAIFLNFLKKGQYYLWYIWRNILDIRHTLEDMEEARREMEFFFPRKKNVAERMVGVISSFIVIVMFFHVGNCFYIAIIKTSYYRKMKEKFCFFFPFRSKGNGKKTPKFFPSNDSFTNITTENASKKKNFINSDYTDSFVYNSKIDSEGILENCISTNALCKYNDVPDSSDFRKSEKVNNRVFQTSAYFDLISKNKTEEVPNIPNLNSLIQIYIKKSFQDEKNEDIHNFYIKELLEILYPGLYNMNETYNSGDGFKGNENINVNEKNKSNPYFVSIDDSESDQYDTFLEFLVDQFLLSIIFD